MPLDPDYESDYDSDDDEDENPKDPYVNTCFCCCNLGIGVILGALFFLVSQICSLAPSSGQISNYLRWMETEKPKNKPYHGRSRSSDDSHWVRSRWDAAISAGDLAGDYYRCHEKKKDFFNQSGMR